jgi:hypothetical protein
MKTLVTTVASIFALLFSFHASLVRAQDVKAVFVQNKEIVTLDSTGELSTLTHDDTPKGLPVWSKDGTRIAYIADIDKHRALADLLVIDSHSGSKITDVLIRPVTTGEGEDMRFIETLEWLTPDKIVAAGSVNLSTEKGVIIDLITGKEVMNYYDDSGSAVYSPDGSHVAYISGAPHFSPESLQNPTLNIDLSKIYPMTGTRVHYLSKEVPSR